MTVVDQMTAITDRVMKNEVLNQDQKVVFIAMQEVLDECEGSETGDEILTRMEKLLDERNAAEIKRIDERNAEDDKMRKKKDRVINLFGLGIILIALALNIFG